MDKEAGLSEILRGLAGFLEEHPDSAASVAASIVGVFAEAAQGSPAVIADAFTAFAKVSKQPVLGRDPQVWNNRPRPEGGGRRENPSAFIRRELKTEYEGGTLTRGMLKQIEGLYNAYATHIGRHPEDDLQLPTQPRTQYEESYLKGVSFPNRASIPSETLNLMRAYTAKTTRKTRERKKAKLQLKGPA